MTNQKHQKSHLEAEMMNKHTPTPWMLNTTDDPGFIFIETVVANEDPQKDRIADLQSNALNNASFIVRAVNSHDALVAVVKELVDCLKDGVTLGIQPGTRGHQKLREALALATSK